jgi:hypothetical protein
MNKLLTQKKESVIYFGVVFLWNDVCLLKRLIAINPIALVKLLQQ